MTTYRVITQDEWDYLTTTGDVSFYDSIIVACDIEATAGRAGDLNVGHPSDVEPYISAASNGSVHFKRVDSLDSASSTDSPEHYTWIGDALARSGAPELSADLQSWDLLDALFPDNPHLWNAGKYLTRFGRKGDASKRVEDLRKAATYLERAIKAEENHAS